MKTNAFIDLFDVLNADNAAFTAWLTATTSPRQRADQLAELSDGQVRELAEIAGPQLTARLIESLDQRVAAEFAMVLDHTQAAPVLDELGADTSAQILRSLTEGRREETLQTMGQLAAPGRDRVAVLRGLLAWPEDSAAAHMTPGFLAVSPDMTVAAAIDHIRAQPSEVEFTYIYATGPGDTLLGIVSFRDLVTASSDAPIRSIMKTTMVTVTPLEDQEDTARLLSEYRISAIPVVDDGVILGIITVDDIADILQEEATEDAERQGGSAPLDVPYLKASPWLLWRKRIVWLLVLFVAELYTGTVMREFEDVLTHVVALSFFIPLLIGTGGNAGTQITTTLIRAMALGDVRLGDVFRVVRKELSTGALIAVCLAVVAWLRAWMLGVGFDVALVVTLSVAAIVMWTALIASVLPLALKKLRIDPAVVSAPLIATLVDGTGLIIYFLIARAVIGL